MQPSTLVGAADALTMFASKRDAIRAGSLPHTEPTAAFDWGGEDELIFMEVARGNALAMIYTSLGFPAERASDLEARLRIVVDGARIVGVDHPVIAEAANALARDVKRFSRDAG